MGTRVRAAVEEAIMLGCADAAAVRHLVEAVDLTRARGTDRTGRAVTLRTSGAGNDRLRWPAQPRGGTVSAEAAALEAATIRQQCKVLRMPTIAAQCALLAEQAVRERRTHLGYLDALLQAELEEREQRLIERRIREARLPRMKTLAEFDFARNPKVSAQQIHELAGAITSRGRSRSSLSAITAPARPIC
jgi:hypothetical protein